MKIRPFSVPRLPLVLALSLLCTPLIRSQTILDFEYLAAIHFTGGTTVAENARLSDQFSSLGVSFRSDAEYAAVINLGQGHAYSGSNGIGGATTEGKLSYSAPVVITFHEPNRPDLPATVDYLSVRVDRAGGGGPIIMSVEDANGLLLASRQFNDLGGAELRIDSLGIHKATITGNGGSALDYLRFGRLNSRLQVLHFEDLPNVGFISGTAVPEEARLSTQFADRGVTFTGPAGAVAVVNLGVGHARSGTLGIGGLEASGKLNYEESGSITISFVHPNGIEGRATTDFVEIWLDRLMGGEGPVRVTLFDWLGVVLEERTVEDLPAQPYLRLQRPNIHQVGLTGNGSTSFDDLWFHTPNPVEPVLEIQINQDRVQVSWPVLANYILEKTSSLQRSTTWETVRGPFVIREGRFTFDLEPTGDESYFRLRKQQ